MQRRVSGLVVLSLAAAMGGVPATAAPCGRAAAAKAGTWFTASPPVRALGAREVFGARESFDLVALDPGNPAAILVSDGSRVLRTADGGCTWKVVYELPLVPGFVPDQHRGLITSIDVARVGGRTRVLLAVLDNEFPLTSTATVLVRSDDGYTGWTPVFDSLTAGVPLVWGATSMPPLVRSAGDVVYAAIPAGYYSAVYVRSADGGRTWTVRTPVAERSATGAILGLAVNPWNANELWDVDMLSRPASLRRSTDGGLSWTRFDPWPTFHDDYKPTWFGADVVWPRRDGPARILVLGSPQDPKNPASPASLGSWSGDGGRTFRVLVPPSSAGDLDLASVAHLGTSGDVVVVADDREAWRIPHLGRPPRGDEWRRLPRTPHPLGCRWWRCSRAGSPALPGVVVFPGYPSHVLILAAPR